MATVTVTGMVRVDPVGMVLAITGLVGMVLGVMDLAITVRRVRAVMALETMALAVITAPRVRVMTMGRKVRATAVATPAAGTAATAVATAVATGPGTKVPVTTITGRRVRVETPVTTRQPVAMAVAMVRAAVARRAVPTPRSDLT